MEVAYPLGHEKIVSECSVLFWLDSVYLSKAGNCILTWICRMPALPGGAGLVRRVDVGGGPGLRTVSTRPLQEPSGAWQEQKLQ